MRKLGIFFMGAILSCAVALGSGNAVTASAEIQEQVVYVGGMSAGFTLKTGGAQIIGMCEVVTEHGVSSPALNAGLRAGDIINKAEDIAINSITELNEIFNKSGGKSIKFTIERG